MTWLENLLSAVVGSSAPSAFGKKFSVLGGTFIIGRAAVALARLGDREVTELVTSVVPNLVDGKILQLKKVNENEATGSGYGNTREDMWNMYLQKTYLKMASMMTKGAREAVMLGGCQKGEILREIAYAYGRNLGMAFQLVDDALDYEFASVTLGKPGGADLQLGLATGPALHAWEEHLEMGESIQRKFGEEGGVECARDYISHSSGVQRARILAQQYKKAHANIWIAPKPSVHAPFAETTFTVMFVQALLYGLHLSTVAHCLRWLLLDDEGLRLRKQTSWFMLMTTTVIFLLMTVDIALGFWGTIGPALNLDLVVFHRLDAADSTISIMVRLTFDAVLVYRCWAVYAKSWRVTLLPLLLWLGCLASAIVTICSNWLLAYPENAAAAFTASAQIYKFLMFFYSCNIAISICATSAIIHRILSVARISSSSEGHLHHICRILLESGVLYALTSILVLASQVAEVEYSFYSALFGNVIGTINFLLADICFNLILIRIGQSRVQARHCQPGSETAMQVVLTTLQFSVITTQDQSVDPAGVEQRVGMVIDRGDNC